MPAFPALWETLDSEDRLIVSGDMNCALTELDRPSGKLDKSSQCLKQLISFNDTVDVWRLLNKDTKQYTYILNDNQRSSNRIDYILKVWSTVKIRGTRVPQKAIVPVGRPRPYSIIILNMRFIPKASLRASSQITAGSYILERHL